MCSAFLSRSLASIIDIYLTTLAPAHLSTQDRLGKTPQGFPEPHPLHPIAVTIVHSPPSIDLTVIHSLHPVSATVG